GHAGDPAIHRVAHALADVVLGVEAAVRRPRELPLRPLPRPGRDHTVLSPRPDLGELRVALDLDAPALILGEMPVEDIELVQRQQIDVLQYGRLRHEVTADIEVAPRHEKRGASSISIPGTLQATF